MRRPWLIVPCALWLATQAVAQQTIYSRQGSIRGTTSLTTGQIARALDANYVGLQAPADDVLLVGNGSTWQDKTLTDCDDTGGNHLNYDTATNAFSCGTSSSGAGSGDVTDVGPGCATGACLTDGLATTGSTLLVWEGTTVDANEFRITVPADPSADITWTAPNAAATITFPSGTRTLATLDGTETLTNKSIAASEIDSGTLALARGGTNQTSWTASRCVQVNSAGTALEAASVGCGGTGAPTDAEYLVAAGSAGLSAERIVAGGDGIAIDTSVGGAAGFSTDSTEANFLKSGALTCGASTQGKMKVHTTPLQYCDNAATPTLQYAAYGNSSGAATSTASGSVNSASITNGSIVPADMDLTQTYDLRSGGLQLPKDAATSCLLSYAESQACWNPNTNKLSVGYGTGRRTFVDTDQSINTTAPLTGGGGLGGNLTLSITANGIGPTQIDETANYAWTGTNTINIVDTSTSGLLSVGAMSASSSVQPASASNAFQTALLASSDYATTTNSTANSHIAVLALSKKSNTGTVGSLYGLYAQIQNTNATGAVTNGYGVYVADSTTTGAITNDYALYTAGGEQSRFGGNLGIGGVNPDSTLRVSTATIGNEVARFESVATNDDPDLRIFQSRKTAAASATTNIDLDLTTAAPTTAPCPASSVCIVEARTVCHCTSGTSCTANDGGGNISQMTVKNNGGTISLLGSVTTPMGSQIGGSSLTSLTLSVNSPSARMAVVVPANFNHTCHVTWLVQNVGT